MKTKVKLWLRNNFKKYSPKWSQVLEILGLEEKDWDSILQAHRELSVGNMLKIYQITQKKK